MNKTTRRLGVPMLLATLGVTSLSAQVLLSVGDVTARAGSVVVVPIVLNQADGLVSALQFRLTFAAGSLSPVPETAVFLSGGDSAHRVLSESSAGEITVVIFSSALETLPAGAVPVAHIALNATGAGPGAEVPIEISEATASGPTGTAIPLETAGGVVTIGDEASGPLAGANRQVFPQIANGTFPGGLFFVSLVFVNRTEVEGEARVTFFKSNGSEFELSTSGGDFGSSFDFTVPASGSAFLATDGTGDFSAGYAVIDSNVPLGGTLIFTWIDNSQVTVTEAGVGASPVGTRFSIPLVFSPGAANTGLALANSSGGQAEVDFVLKDASGQEIARETRSFAAGSHDAVFGSALFPELEGGGLFEGSIEISSSVPVSVVTLKQLSSGLLTTLPVVVPVN